MPQFPRWKFKILLAVFILSGIFLLSSQPKEAQAVAHVYTDYLKSYNDTLGSQNWNDLLGYSTSTGLVYSGTSPYASGNFVNTWLPAAMLGPLGINTPPSLTQLSIKGAGNNVLDLYNSSSTNIFTVQNNGNVGIGTTAPGDLLSIGTQSSSGSNLGTGHNSTMTYLSTDSYALVNYGLLNSVVSSAIGSSGANFWFGTSTSAIWNTNTGNVGIGTTAPAATLDINGSIRWGGGVNLTNSSNVQIFPYNKLVSGVNFAYGPGSVGEMVFRYYVDATNGNDNNDGQTWATAKRQIQAVINDLPTDLLNHKVYIYVKSGSYTAVTVNNKNGSIYFIWAGTYYNTGTTAEQIWARNGAVNPIQDNNPIIVYGDANNSAFASQGTTLDVEFYAINNYYAWYQTGYAFWGRWQFSWSARNTNNPLVDLNSQYEAINLVLNLNNGDFGLTSYGWGSGNIVSLGLIGGSVGLASTGTGIWWGAIGTGGSTNNISFGNVGGGYGFDPTYTNPHGVYFYASDINQLYAGGSSSNQGTSFIFPSMYYEAISSTYTKTNILLNPEFRGTFYYRSDQMTVTDNTTGSKILKDLFTGIMSNYLSKNILDNGTNVGIGMTNPGAKLDISTSLRAQSANISGFWNSAGLVMTDNSGNLYSNTNPVGTATLPTGANGQTLRNSGGTSWVADSNLFNTGTSVGIGTTNPRDKLAVNGGGMFLDFSTGGVTSGASWWLSSNANQAFIGSNQYYSTTDKYARNGGASRIALDQTTGSTAGNINFLTAPSGTADGSISWTNAMTIQRGGNVGIGVTNPALALDIRTSTNGLNGVSVWNSNSGTAAISGIYFANNNQSETPVLGYTSSAYSGYGGPNTFIANSSSRDFAVVNSSREVARFTNSGNVGIGTTGPGTKLDLNGTTEGEASSTYSTTLANSLIQLGDSTYTGTKLLGGVGTNATYYWLQAQHTNNTPYNIVFNPVGGNVGIGTTAPGTNLDIKTSLRAQSANLSGFWNSAGLVMTDNSGNLYSNTNPSGTATLPTGVNGQTLRNSGGTSWVANSALFNNGTNVGIGTTAPGANLDIYNTGTALPAATGTAQSVGQKLRLGRDDGAVLDIGSAGTSGLWLQTANGTNLATTYPLLLNPNGGNVGIGAVSNNDRLAVQGGRSTFVSGLSGQRWSTAILIPINAGVGNQESETAPNRGMRILQYNSGTGGYGGGIAWGMAPQSDNTWLSGSWSSGQFLLAYDGGTLTLQGSNVSSGTPLTISPSTFVTFAATGNVGIGAAPGSYRLNVTGGDIYGSGNATLAGTTGLTLSGAGADLNFTSTGPNTITTASGANLALMPGGTNNVGIGTTAPGTNLDIKTSLRAQSANLSGFWNSAGLVMTDNSGNLYSNTNPSGTISLPTGVNGQTLRNSGGTSWVADSNLFNTGTNVGIGTTNPNTKLEVSGGAYTGNFVGLKIVNTNSSSGDMASLILAGASTGVDRGQFTADNNSGDVSLGNNSAYNLKLFTNGIANPRLTINGSGNIGVGLTNPAAYLDVSPGSTTGNTIFQAFSPANANYNTNDVAVIQQGPAAGASVTGTVLKVQSRNNDQSTYALLNVQNNITTTPSSKLYVRGDGNVGIGTTAPGANLDIKTSLRAQSANLSGFWNSAGLVMTDNSGNLYSNTNPSGTISLPTGVNGQTLRNNGGTSWVANSVLFNNGTNVGIGTTAPRAPLEVVGKTILSGSNARLSLQRTDGINYLEYNPANNFIIRSINSDDTSPTNRLVIDTSGNVGIGTTNPLTRLQVNIPTNVESMTLGTASGEFSMLGSTGTYGLFGGVGNSGNAWLQVGRNDANATPYNLILQSAGGNVGIGTTAPGTNLDIKTSLRAQSANLSGFWNSAGLVMTDNSGNLYSNTNPSGTISLPSGVNGQTLRNSGGTSWVANSVLFNNGTNVGIGTTGPGTKLDLNGTTEGEASSTYSTTLANSLIQLGDSTYTGTKLLGGVGTNATYYWLQAQHTNNTPYNIVFNPVGGNVGIGTTNPGTLLQLSSTTNAKISLIGNSSVTAQLSADDTVNPSRVGTITGHRFYVMVSGTNVLKLDENSPVVDTMTLKSGNVGIGTTNPGSKLEVVLDTSSKVAFTDNFTNFQANVNTDSATAPNFIGVKGRGTLAAPSAAQTNDGLMFIGGRGYPLTTTNAGAIRILAAENFATGHTGSYITFETTPIGSVTRAEIVRIDSTGNVGIGTTAPGTNLDIKTSLRAQSANLSGFWNSAGLVMTDNSGNLYSNTNPVGTATLPTGANGQTLRNSGGTSWVADSNLFNTGTNVGIGTTNPGQILDIQKASGDSFIHIAGSGSVKAGLKLGANLTGTYGELYFDNSTNNVVLQQEYSAGNLILGTNSSEDMRITNSGNVGIGTTNPISTLNVNGGGLTISSTANNDGWVDFGNGGTRSDEIYASSLNSSYSGISLLSNTRSGFSIASSSIPSWWFDLGGTAAGSGYGKSDSLSIMRSPAGSALQSAGNVTFLTINNSGNVGIGTTAPGTNLDIKTSLRAQSANLSGFWNSAGLVMTDNSGNLYSNTNPSGTATLPTGTNGQTLRNSGGTSWVANSVLFNDGTNVGIGITNPGGKLNIGNPNVGIPATTGSSDAQTSFQIGYSDHTWAGGELDFGMYNSPQSYATWIQARNPVDYSVNRNIILQPNGGSVGIGTTAPGAYRLKVAGDMAVTGTLSTQTGSDFAEEFAVAAPIAPGTVVVMGDLGYKSVKASDAPYDPTVVGVVSDNPSIVAGRSNILGADKVIVAMVGVVSVKVTAENGPIVKGDLLTTSNRAGYAMKAANDRQGTIIGKALEDLNGQSGEIKVLVNLQ